MKKPQEKQKKNASKKSSPKLSALFGRKELYTDQPAPESFPYLYIALREPCKDYKEEPAPKEPLYRIVKIKP